MQIHKLFGMVLLGKLYSTHNMVIKNWLFRQYKHVISYVPPTIIYQPIGGNKQVGSDYTIFVKLKGSRTLTYQWYKDSTLIPHASTNALPLTNLQPNDSGVYYCRVGNNRYSYNSEIATLNVKYFPTITVQPISYTIQKGSQISLNLTAGGDPPFTFSWYKDGELTDATATNYYINNAIISDTGYYYAVVTNDVGTITSDTVFLSVYS